jgi:hypothetical protein
MIVNGHLTGEISKVTREAVFANINPNFDDLVITYYEEQKTRLEKELQEREAQGASEAFLKGITDNKGHVKETGPLPQRFYKYNGLALHENDEWQARRSVKWEAKWLGKTGK